MKLISVFFAGDVRDDDFIDIDIVDGRGIESEFAERVFFHDYMHGMDFPVVIGQQMNCTVSDNAFKTHAVGASYFFGAKEKLMVYIEIYTDIIVMLYYLGLFADRGRMNVDGFAFVAEVERENIRFVAIYKSYMAYLGTVDYFLHFVEVGDL